MESVCMASTQLPLLRPNFSPSNDFTPRFKSRPFIYAAISNSIPTARISHLESINIPHEKPVPSLPTLPLVSAESVQYPDGFLVAPAPEHSVEVSDAMCQLRSILASKVYDVAMETPLEFAPKLSQKLGVKVWLKREDLQPVSGLILSNFTSNTHFL